jgi:hypothetical protein
MDQFGRVRPVSTIDAVVYRLRLKNNHQGVLCNRCWHILHPTVSRPLVATAVLPSSSSASVDMGDAAADLLSLLQVPLSSSATPLPSPVILGDVHPIARAVSLPLQVGGTLTSPVCDDSRRPRLTRTRSAPPCKRPHLNAATQVGERLREVLSNTIAGDTWSQYSKRYATSGRPYMTEPTWHKHLKCVMTAAKTAWSQIQMEYVEGLVQRGQPVVIAADGAWSHRSDANQHEFTMMNAEDGKVIACIDVSRRRFIKGVEMANTGNYYGSSKGMEAVGMTWALKAVQITGLLPLVRYWVSDKDLSVARILRENKATAHMKLLYDPGHIKKNLVNSIKLILKTSARYKGIALRIGRFWLRLVKRAEVVEGSWKQRAEQARKWMRHIIPHYTGQCGIECPHLQQFGQEDIDSVPTADEMEDSGEDGVVTVEGTEAAALIMGLVEKGAGYDEKRRFLNLDLTLPNLGKKGDFPADDRERVAKITALVEAVIDDVDNYVHGYSTCNLERFHSQRTALTSKRIEFWKNWGGLLALTALIHNEGYPMTTALLLTEMGVGVDDATLELTRRLERKRHWHRARKASFEYNKRKSQLSQEQKRRKAREVPTAASLPAYTPNSPLYSEAELKAKATTDAPPIAPAVTAEAEVKEGVTAKASAKSKSERRSTAREGKAQRRKPVKRKIVYEESGKENDSLNTSPQRESQKRREGKAKSRKRVVSGGVADTQSSAGARNPSTPHIVLTIKLPNEATHRRSTWILR